MGKPIHDLRQLDMLTKESLLEILLNVHECFEVADEYMPDEGAECAGWMDTWTLVQQALEKNAVLETERGWPDNLIGGEQF